MDKIINYIRQQIREDFHLSYYVSVALFLAACLGINYKFHIYDRYINILPGTERIIINIIFFGFGYFVPVIFLAYFKNKSSIFISREFLLKSLFGILILGVENAFPYIQQWISNADVDVQFYYYRVGVKLVSVLTIMVPLFLFYSVFDKQRNRMYGLGNFDVDWKPYFIMLLIMVPVIALASTTTGFKNQYPMYEHTDAHVFIGVPEYMTVGIYECAYGIDFINIELLFRGFFVIGMMAVLGRASIVPMVSVYCFLHFGKPVGEAVSSIFGGYLLGALAYETGSIWGGIVVHIGIAWMMELSAFIARNL